MPAAAGAYLLHVLAYRQLPCVIMRALWRVMGG